MRLPFFGLRSSAANGCAPPWSLSRGAPVLTLRHEVGNESPARFNPRPVFITEKFNDMNRKNTFSEENKKWARTIFRPISFLKKFGDALRRCQNLRQFYHGILFGNFFDRRDFTGQTANGRFINLTLAIGLFGLIPAPMQVANDFCQMNQIT